MKCCLVYVEICNRAGLSLCMVVEPQASACVVVELPNIFAMSSYL